MLLEGLAATAEEAEAALARGDGVLAGPLPPPPRRSGPMAGVVSPSMWMFELRDPVHGGTAWCSLNEGLGKVLRYGAYGPEVVERLRWMSDVLGPLLQTAVRSRASQPVDVKAIAAQMLQMGDEGHNRNRAGTLMFLRELLPDLIESGRPDRRRRRGGPVRRRQRPLLPQPRDARLQAGLRRGPRRARARRVVVAMARNGTDFGIQVSGTGDRWFTGPANTPDGLYLGSFGPDDANPDIGDSAITETGGIGGFAMAAAPAIVRFVGGEVADAIEATRLMYEITLAENPTYQIPVLGFRGTPDRASTSRWSPAPGSCRTSTPAWPARSPAPARSAPGWSTRRPTIFPAAVAALAGLAPPLAQG